MRCFAATVVLLTLPMVSCQSSTCAAGLFEVNGTCADQPDCGTCGARQVCDGSQLPYTCKCAPGYAGDSCEWIGVVSDERFQRLEDEDGERYWVDEGGKGAAVLLSTDGPNGGGEGSLLPSVACNAGALSQMVVMPPYELAGALVAEVTYQAQNVGGFAIGFNRAWKYLPATSDGWSTARFCLGEAAYGDLPGGGPVKVQLSAAEQGPDCFTEDPQGSIRIDRFVIEPARPEESCPEPGSVLNGDAQLSQDGWRFTTQGDAEAELMENEGRDGTDGVRLFRATDATGLAAATTKVSVPMAAPDTLPAPALRFWWRGTSQHVFPVEIGTFVGIGEARRSVESLLGINAGDYYTYCLPPWTHGNVVDLSFSLSNEDRVETELVVDDVEVIVLDECSDSRDLLDPSFEAAPKRWMGSYMFGSRNQAVTMWSDSALSNTGEGVLELSYWTSEAHMWVENFVFVPPSVEAGGPQLVFYSKVPSEPQTKVEWVLGGVAVEGSRGPLETGGGWRPSAVCLPPEWSNRWYRFQIRIEPSPGAGDVEQTKKVFLDDFGLTTSPDCPRSSP